MERMMEIQIQAEQRLDGTRQQCTDQCQIFRIALCHLLDEMATHRFREI